MSQSSEKNAWPARLHHDVPGWVKAGATFHIRLRKAPMETRSLIDPELANALISAVKNYHQCEQWHCSLFMIMPDHIHALVAFRFDQRMTRVVGSWKRYVARAHGIVWQTNFFDHRIRNDAERTETWTYILRNPIVKGLCASEGNWPWVWCGD